MSPHSPTEPLELTDRQVQNLLVEAYDVPPIPKSLEQRLDRISVEQWGVVPDQSEVAPRLRRVPAGTWKVLSIAASLLLAVTFIIQPWNAARADGWNALVEALSRHGWIEAVEQGGATTGRSSYVSLHERTFGSHTAEGAIWIDYGGSKLLQHDAGDPAVVRRSLDRDAAAPTSETLVIALLCGDRDPAAGNRQVIRQRRQREGDRVRLDMTFSGDGPQADPMQVAIWLDPRTHLPLESRITDGHSRGRAMTFRYLESETDSAAERWLARAIPAELPVVDVDVRSETSASAAIALSEDRRRIDVNRSLGVGERSQGGSESVDASAKQDDAAAQPQSRPAVLQGAASLDWTPLQAQRLSGDEVVRRVDELLAQLWQQEGVEPVAPAHEEELLRRVYLDLAGRTPTVNEIRSYLEDTSPDRYPALVRRLLDGRDHATHLATRWRSFLIPDGIDLSRLGGVEAFDAWLSDRFYDNQPYDALVRDLLTAEGRLAGSGPLLFYAALKLDADEVAAKSARAFLGMRLDCAQCHDDPFEPWTQEDFWGFAAYFARISRPQAALESVSSVMRVRDIDRGEVMMPESDFVVPPKLLDGSAAGADEQTIARRRQLADWLTARDNPYFAKAAVNRVWAQMFGRGIVDPVDGFGELHPPVSPELLDLLAGQFIQSGFDLRELFRTVALSRAYRLTSGADDDDGRRQQWFAQQRVKMLTAEQLYDAITVATLLDTTEPDSVMIQRFGNPRRNEFLSQFRTVGSDPTEYQAGIPQALTLMNGELITGATGVAGSGLLKSLEAPFFTDDQRIEVLYLATLSRRPTAAQWPLLRRHVAARPEGTSVTEPLADILWALLNSAEFVMNH